LDILFDYNVRKIKIVIKPMKGLQCGDISQKVGYRLIGE